MNYKVVLISFILLFSILGAVSAEELNSTDSLGTDNVNEIYVNDTGDDSNVGSSDSPYATIGRAIRDVNESDDVTIYIGKGTFSTENDADFNLKFNHTTRGGNLKFIGAGTNETFLDGQSASRFAIIGLNSNITFKNLTFINFKANNGGTLYCEGILTIDNCVFKNSYVTGNRGGAIFAYLNAARLDIRNSEFISCSANGVLDNNLPGYGGGAIFANSISYVYLENNTFVNTRVNEKLKGFAVNIDNSDRIDTSENNYGRFLTRTYILNNRFINITANENSFDAGIYISGGSWAKDSKNTFIEGNTFINCSNPSDKYSIVYLDSRNTTFENNVFINSTNSVGNVFLSKTFIDVLNITVGNHSNITNFEITNGLNLSVNITDDMGNIIWLYGYDVGDMIVRLVSENNNYVYQGTLGRHVDFHNNIPDPGTYTLTISFLGIDYFSTDITVVYDSTPVELWVSPSGLDINNGTMDSPFETIENAINVGFGKSFNVIIHLLEGTYSGEDNVALTISNMGSLLIMGEDRNTVVIDAENRSWFIRSDTNVTVRNVKFINGYCDGNRLLTTGIGGSSLFLDNCTIDHCRVDNDYILSRVSFDNLIYTNNVGIMLASEVVNSYFENNTNPDAGDGLNNINLYGGIIREVHYIFNSTFINNSAEFGGVILAQSYDNIVSVNNYYANNHARDGGVFYILYTSNTDSNANNRFTSYNDTFIGNYAQTNGAIGFKTKQLMGETTRYPNIPTINITNARFINNSAQRAGALVIQKGTIVNSSFVNNTADYGGAIAVVPNNESGANSYKVNMENITFSGNCAKKGNDIYLSMDIDKWYPNQKVYFALPLNITFNGFTTENVSDYLTANVYGPCGAVIGGSKVNFNFNGNNVGYCELVNSNVKLRFNGFENGEFVLSGDVDSMDKSSIVNDGIITVNILDYVSSKEVWVSNRGSDSNGDGSKANPFKTIGHAIDESTHNCLNVIIHIESGTYAGNLNTELEVSSTLNLALKGEDGTVIDGENNAWFIKVLRGNNKITISDLTIMNMGADDIQSGGTVSIAPITVDEGANLCLDNVLITKNHGGEGLVKNDGNLEIKDSLITKNGFSRLAIVCGGNVNVDNTSFIDNFGTYGSFSCENILINNSIIRNSFNVGRFLLIEGDSVIENTMILNDGDNSSLKELELDEISVSLAPALSLGGNVNMKNVSIINSYKGPITVVESVRESYSYLSLIGYVNPAGYSGRQFSAIDCSFYNFTYLWVLNDYGDLDFNFDGCLFKNITQICQLRAVGPNSKWVFTNSVFLDVDLYFQRPSYFAIANPTQVSHTNGVNDIPYENNFWASSSKPVIRYADGQQIIFNYTPKNWIVLNNVNGVLKLQQTNGRTVRDYNGGLPLSINYALNNGEMIPVITVDGKSYPISFVDGNIQIGSSPVDASVLKPAVGNTLLTGDLAVTYADGSKFIAKFLYPWGDPLANTNVTFSINDMNYTAITDENGTISVDVNFESGVHEIVTLNPVSKQINANTIVVNKANPKLTASDVSVVYNSGKYLVINLNAPGTVTVVLNGKTIKKVSDGKNPVKIPITLTPKTYTATITYEGNANYLKASTKATVKVTKATPKLTAKKATLKNKKYTITLKDNQNKAMKKVKVTLKVKGKTYKAKTNAKGKATFKLTKLTKKGKYTAKVKFAGNKCYKAKSVKVKITVK